MGTAELVALALAGRQKHFDFISSLAVVPYLDRSAGIDERSPLRPTMEISDRYSAHYGASKWAAEQVLQSAHRRFGLPITVFRGDMMLAHRHFHRQINVPDVFARLLYSVAVTGLAPASFYELTPDGRPPRAHYDGLPVDFIAAAVVAVASSAPAGIETYHVINPHDDGVSLDTIVDWIDAAGHRVERVADYADWLGRFEAALTALPEAQRQHSSLSVLASLQRPARATADLPGSAVFSEAVRRVAPEPEIPHVTESFIAKCLDDLVELDLIRAPAGTSAH
jgi:fatty acid CoA ligase FadD9